MVDENGIIKTVAGSRRTDRLGDGDRATKASLAGPVGVAVDRRGNLLISEFDGGRIRMVDPGGRITTIAGGGEAVMDAGPAHEALLSGLWDIAVAAPGVLYFGDAFKGRVYALRYDDRP
jgi:serine/threonine-protein kinase